MWTSKIIQVTKKEGKATISIEYTNGNEVIIKDYYAVFKGVDKDWLNGQIRDEIDTFESIYAFANSLKTGPITPIDPIVISPTPNQIKKDQFGAKVRELKTKKVFLDLGLITQANYDILKDEVKALGIDAGEL